MKKKVHRYQITVEFFTEGKVDKHALSWIAEAMEAQLDSLEDGTFDIKNPPYLLGFSVSYNSKVVDSKKKEK